MTTKRSLAWLLCATFPVSACSGEPAPGAGTPLPNLGPLPDQVYFRTNTETFNRRYYFGAHAGGIFWKPNVEVTGLGGEWQRLPLPPEIDGKVYEISADDNEMIALTTARAIWSMTGALSEPPGFSWKSNWGFPFWSGPGQSLPDTILRWEWSVISPKEDIYWVDPAGNSQPVGQGKVSHIWMLPADQQRLTYIDPWLPLDFSYGMCGPLRDRFRAENLAASGSTIFVIGRYGDMFTRLFDFDISGADTVFFEYSYEDQTGMPGAPPIQLPPPDWVQQPKIDGEITGLITLFKLGEGGIHRTLRVEGTRSDGATGYFEKDIADLNAAAWTFHETGQPLRGTPLDNRAMDSAAENLGNSGDLRFSRNLDLLAGLDAADGIQSADDWAAELGAFHVHCSPTPLRIHVSSDTAFELVLHAADTVRTTPRAAGLDAWPRDFNATVEVPQALLDTLPAEAPAVQDFVQNYLGAKRFTTVGLRATSDELVICSAGATSDGTCAVDPWRFTLEAP
jgi:hypothetical protein